MRRVITKGGSVVSDKTDEIFISLGTLRIKILDTPLHANDPAEPEKMGKEKTNKNKRTSYGQTIIPCYCLHTFDFSTETSSSHDKERDSILLQRGRS